jgi:hypothetical protein
MDLIFEISVFKYHAIVFKMIKNIQLFLYKLWDEKPLTLILLAGGFFRLLAVLFSKGYGMYDDQYFVIEVAQSWLDGNDYYSWLPGSKDTQVMGHHYLYACIHYLLLGAMKFVGMNDPQNKMYLIRLLHAALSMLTISVGYKIANYYGGLKAAREAGLLLAVFFIFPFLSVHTLFETTPIPLLVLATWLLLKTKDNFSWSAALWAGVCLALAFALRLQFAFFFAGLGLALLWDKQWKQLIGTTIGFILMTLLVQLGTDIMIFGKPFVQISKYIQYNLANSETFGISPWYKYLLFAGGILIPPMSILLLGGYFIQIKNRLLLFLPTLLFFAFHSYFPNKQERFILPALPFIIISGVIGWNYLIAQSTRKFPASFKRIAWIVFLILNTLPLFVISTTYSKRSMVEAMYFLYQKKYKGSFVLEQRDKDANLFMPVYYTGAWNKEYYVNSNEPAKAVRTNAASSNDWPSYVFFFEKKNLSARVDTFKKYFPGLRYETTIEPSFTDKLMHTLNPINANYTAYVYYISYENDAKK